MRLLQYASLALLPVAALITGCGFGVSANESPIDGPALSGNLMGGPTPITNATMKLMTIGSTGYGAGYQTLATTTSGAGGSFTFAGKYTCPNANTPLIILSVGGNNGADTNNTSAVLGVLIGRCGNASSLTALTVNEVTTAALAYTLGHYFNDVNGTNGYPSTAGFNAGDDGFGGPVASGAGAGTFSAGINLAVDQTYNDLVNISYGGANFGNNGATIEGSQMVTLADILAVCVESTHSTSTTETKTKCGKLFSYTAGSMTTRPQDTLQAAVMIALNPTVSVKNLYNLIPATGYAFSGYDSAQPNDFSIAESFSANDGSGLVVPAQLVTTADVDTNGNVWMPSNSATAPGLVSFSARAHQFTRYQPSGIVSPTQVAVDSAGYVWTNDTGSSNVFGFSTTTPSSSQVSFSLPGSTSTALTVEEDNTITYGVLNGSAASLAKVNPAHTTYSAVASSSVGNFPIESLAAGSGVDGVAINASPAGTSTVKGFFWSSSAVGSYPAGVTPVYSNNAGTAGQVIYVGYNNNSTYNDFIGLRSYDAGGSPAFCVFSAQACVAETAAGSQVQIGMVIDGGGTIWAAQQGYQAVAPTPFTTSANSGGAAWENSTPKFVNANNLVHTSTMPSPAGVAVDFGGNIYVTNAGCTTTGCTPSALTVTMVVGAATPTVTPVSANIVLPSGVATTGYPVQY